MYARSYIHAYVCGGCVHESKGRVFLSGYIGPSTWHWTAPQHALPCSLVSHIRPLSNSRSHGFAFTLLQNLSILAFESDICRCACIYFFHHVSTHTQVAECVSTCRRNASAQIPMRMRNCISLSMSFNAPICLSIHMSISRIGARRLGI